MPRQIDQDVDAVVANTARDSDVLRPMALAHMIAAAPKPCGHRVLVARVERIRVDGDPAAIMLLQHGCGQRDVRMIPDIRRQVADLQAGIAAAGRAHRRQPRCGSALIDLLPHCTGDGEPHIVGQRQPGCGER